MKFVVVTHIAHKKKGNNFFSYEPYVREMNLWFKCVDKVRIVGAFTNDKINNIESPYIHNNLTLKTIPEIDITSFKNSVKAIVSIPLICFKIYKAMKWADHIHLRCPSNIGLISACIQVFFPNKPKTVKYAGNWDPKSKQPWSYRLQKGILSNSFLSRNMKVLVYGEWPNQTKNIVPFFTATYSEKELIPIPLKSLKSQIQLIFVGGLTPGKQPLISIQVCHSLLKLGKDVSLDIYGEGVERARLEEYIATNKLQSHVRLHGNVSKEYIKKAFQKSHFLLFISKSEGWPKVVAEAMMWGCIPITSKVSCIPFMLADGKRGSLVNANVHEISSEILSYLESPEMYFQKSKNAVKWSQKFTLEYFESQIKLLLKN
ncbi:glycosyltransferase [Urechidicola sp. KH5]